MPDTTVYRASTTAPVNIAVIKYWGKRDPALNLPSNSSLSVTLAQSDLRTHTTASCSAQFPPSPTSTDLPQAADTLLLNSAPQDLSAARPAACLAHLRRLRAALEAQDATQPPLSTYPLRLVSENNFPTAAGLASSAAGFAALVRAVADLYRLPQSPAELSEVARQGSGSACRSLMGGYVAWDAGSAADGADSRAREVAPASHWPEMRAVVLVASAEKKAVSSTAGMQATVKTSELFATRAEKVVPKAMREMEEAIAKKDFEAFAKVTMRESNSFHACCLDTEPPIFYLNAASQAAIRAVEEINAKAGRFIAAYTFDAGPNAVVYHLEKDAAVVAGTFKKLLGDKEGWDGKSAVEAKLDEAQAIELDERVAAGLKEGISRVIYTKVGEGPVSVEEHLVDEQGQPVKK